MQSIVDWLQSLGLDQYHQVFADNDIDLELISSLSDQDLKELGVSSMGHRKKLLKAIAERGDDGGAALAATLQTTEPSPAPRVDTDVAERRQLTVMFCDLVGSTALSQQFDPETLRELMRSYQQSCGTIIDKYGGHVAQYLGDGLMVYFGWPRAHEDDAERAIRAGLEIVEAVKQVQAPDPLRVRVGIATGQVVVGETGGGDASIPKLAVGETPNLAARIQGLALADEIIIGPDTRRLVGGTFKLEDSGEHALKGIVERVRAWRVTGIAETAGRFDAAHGIGALIPMIGRDLELGLLMDRWSRTQEGEGQVVLLSGEPGIGKSRILSALREKLESEGAASMRFQCSPFYVNSAFWPSTESFERALKFTRDEPPESKLDKLESLMVGHYKRPLADVRFIAAMVSVPCDARYGELVMTPQKFKDETLRSLVDLTEAAARKQPSVLLFEDLHWSDPTTLEVLDLMIDRVKTIPLLMVMTHRPEFRNRWVERGHVSALNLSKLTRAQSSAVVSRLAAGKALPEGLPERIIAKTDGVPLYVEELTRSILESGELIDTGDQYEYAGGSRSVNIPATLRDSLMARLDRVKPVKEIAQIGAVIGREFSYELISVAAQLSTSQLDDVLVQLADSGLAFRRGTPPDAVYTFKHALVQDAAYDSLLKSRRQELHARIAGAIEKRFTHTKETEPEILAHHLTAAGETDSAIPLWQKAGEIALKRTALAEAISHLSRGLDLVKTSPASEKRDVSELLLRTSTGAAWQALQGWGATEVWNSLRPALDLAKSLSRHDELVPIYWGLVQNVMTHGHLAESLKWALEMLEEATTSGHSDLLVEGHMAVCTCNYWMGKLGESMEHADEVLTLYCEEQHSHLVKLVNNDARTAASGYASQATWRLGFPDRAVLLSDQAVEHARRLGHPFDLGHALTIGSDVFDLRCDADELRRRAEEAEQLGQENNLPLLYGYLAPCRLGISYIRKGDHAKGLAPLKAGLAAWEATGGKIRIPYLKAVLAEGMALVGEINDALHVIDEQIEQAERPGWEERSDYAEILRLKGWVLTLKKEFAGAENSFLASLDVAREQQAKSWELRTSTSLARLWQSQGKCEEALDLLAPVYDWFTEGFDTKDLKDAKALLGELSA